MDPHYHDKVMKRSCIIRFAIIILLTCMQARVSSQYPDGFKQVNNFNEREVLFTMASQQVTVNINAPLHFQPDARTYIIFYALPNGNSIEWTKGKKIQTGDDWHFDIQHIAAQIRYIRNTDKKNNYVIAYLMTQQKSWPLWKRTYPGSNDQIRKIVDSVTDIFGTYHPRIILNGHSGGGSFIFGYLDALAEIPSYVERIAFLDSNYGYEDSLHKEKLTRWLKNNKKSKLIVLAYNDSIVIYNGKPLVSPTGGTWYRSRLLQKNLGEFFSFKIIQDTSLITYTGLGGRIKIILKQNPLGLIYHTILVEKNGFIYSIFSGSKFDNRKYFSYFGKRAYENLIEH